MSLSVRPSSPEKYNDKIKFQSFQDKTEKSQQQVHEQLRLLRQLQ